MLRFLRYWSERWASWVGDRDMELAIRSRLSKAGLRGQSAEFSHVRLVAIQRPGWLQIYSFDVTCTYQDTTQPASIRLFGLVRQDERFDRTEIEWFEAVSDRCRLLHQWSEGMHGLRRP